MRDAAQHSTLGLRSRISFLYWLLIRKVADMELSFRRSSAHDMGGCAHRLHGAMVTESSGYGADGRVAFIGALQRYPDSN